MKANGAKAFDLKACKENNPVGKSLYRSSTIKAKSNTSIVKQVTVLKCKRLYSHQNGHDKNKASNPMVNNGNLYML